MLTKFENPIYVTRPVLPDLESLFYRLEEIWKCKLITNNGPKHNELECILKKYLKADNISLFSNGTLALLLGIKSLELDGEVITTPFTFPATLNALKWNNLTPIFCDVKESSLNIDEEKIESLITHKTSAILAVHTFGNFCDVEKIQEIADKYKLKVIYDCAHTFGSHINGKAIGNFGDMAMFSFHATKVFNTFEGGALIYRDEKLYQKLNLLKNNGIENSEEVRLPGINAKLNEIQAAIGLEVLKLVEEEEEKRKKIREEYIKNLENVEGIKVITKENSCQYFVIEIQKEYGKSRDWIHEELKKYKVFTRKYFYPLCSDFNWYKNLESARPKNLAQAHKSVNQVLTLPFYGDLEIEDVKKICEIIKFLKEE
jgi:dTDP-4-amino-4,6-dideoxygalactose transaminase